MRHARRPLLLLALVGTAIAIPALAQTNASTVHLTYAETCDPARVTKADTDKAKKLYELAADFIKESNYDNAIDLLKRAYDTDCRAVELLLGLASVFERAGNRGEAVRALEEYLRRVPNAPDRETIEKRIRNLGGPSSNTASATSSTTSTPTASATTSATTTSSGASTATGTATSTAPTAVPTTTTTTGGGGHTIAPWIVVGVGGAAVITGTVLTIIGAGKVSDAEKECSNGHNGCPQSAVDSGNSGRHLETAGVIIGIAGLGIAGAGVLWHFLEPTAPKREIGKPRVVPQVAPGYAGVSLGGSF